MAYGAGRFVAVGFVGTIAVSTDGSTWSARRENFSNFVSLNGVVFARDLFVIVGSSGVIVTTPDGGALTQQVSHTTRQLSAVTFGVDHFVAVGGDLVVDTSNDGITWETQ